MKLKLISILYSSEGYTDRVKMLDALSEYTTEHIIITNKQFKLKNKASVFSPSKPLKSYKFWIWSYLAIRRLIKKDKGKNWIIHEYLSGITILLLSLNIALRKSIKLKITSLYSIEYNFLISKGWRIDKYSNNFVTIYQDILWLKKAIPTTFINYLSWLGSDIIIGNSSAVTNDYSGFFKKKKTKIMKTAIDTRTFKPYEINSDKKVTQFLFVGRINSPKGIGLLFKALSDLYDSGQKFHLTVIGSPWEFESEWYSKLIKHYRIDRFSTILEKLPQSTLVDFYNKSDCFLFPSFYEGSPRVIKEAMSCGCLCLCSNIPGNKVIDPLEESLMFFDVTNLESLKNKILFVLNNLDKLKHRKKTGRSNIITHSPDNVAKELYNLYQDCI